MHTFTFSKPAKSIHRRPHSPLSQTSKLLRPHDTLSKLERVVVFSKTRQISRHEMKSKTDCVMKKVIEHHAFFGLVEARNGY
ncbi:hypothetical protein Pst134EB_008597 [Puccinia striiformis f. sp. tritici]|nr:hypothetical protein Pst134EB_008597 [Puccinia striiformis f. sp. tritici]